MKKEITLTATDLFLNLGFKSVTMDDIANKMGISKKTIYAHFPTKSKLVEATTFHLLETIDKGIEEIRKKELNAIVELFEIKKFVMDHLKDEKSSPQFQLNKYYPRIYEKVQKHHLDAMHCSVAENLERGIEEGDYRPSIPVDFISRFYFVGMMAIKNNEIFPVTKYSMRELTEKYLEYHLRAIVTPRGLKKLKEFLTIED
jgi:AcrR family transcriptional regulator